MRFIVLTGLPGVGKTAMLERLAAAGEQVIDLEALAGHRGSSFGRVGLTSTEPTKREFDALVSRALAACDPARPVWLEDEGPHIGRLWLPDEIVERDRDGPDGRAVLPARREGRAALRHVRRRRTPTS